MIDQDAYVGWVKAQLNGFADWLVLYGHQWEHGARGVIGEWGVPGADHAEAGGTGALVTTADKAAWEAMATFYLRELARCGLKATWWAGGADWPAVAKGDARDYTLLNFGATNYDQPLSITHRGGQNLADASRPYPGINGTNVTGFWDVNDTNPPQALAGNFTYLRSRNVDLVRVPFRWRIFQSSEGQPLNPVHVAVMTRLLDNANAAGVKVLLDLHMFGKDWRDIDGQPCTKEQLADFWVKMARQFGNHPAVAFFGLMNEPNDQSSGYRGAAGFAWWSDVSSYVYNAIRAVHATVPLLVPTYAYDNIASVWQNYPGGPWIAPEANLWWEGHDYWDVGGIGGTYPNSFASYQKAAPFGPYNAAFTTAKKTFAPAAAFVEDETALTPRYAAGGGTLDGGGGQLDAARSLAAHLRVGGGAASRVLFRGQPVTRAYLGGKLITGPST